LIVGLLVTPGRVAADGAVPIEGKGSVAGNSGAFTYAISIAVAPGRHGLAPNLALTYNSSGGNGIVGVGWDLPIGYVMRSTRHGVDYTCNSGSNCFVFMLGGASSELIPRTDWCSDCYGAKVEGAFIKFRFISTTYWEATDKSGTNYRLGYTTSSRQDNPGNTNQVFKWMLDKVTDTNTNSMTYSYLKNQGEIFLDRIDYANNTYVKCYYDQSRTDTAEMAGTNFSVVTAWRLKTIDVWGGGTRVRAYKLVYDTAPSTSGDQYSVSTGRSLLTTVQQYGNDATLDGSGTVTGGTSLPAVSLTGQVGGKGPFDRVLTDTTGAGQWPNTVGQTNYLVDVNGDGRIDHVWVGSAGTYVELGWGDGTFHRVLTDTTGAGQWSNTVGQTNYLVDVNGDDIVDHVWIGSAGTYVELGTGPAPDLMSSIATGLGSTMNITYTTSTSFVNTYLPFPVHIVSQITQTTTLDGNGSTATSTRTYLYAGGFYHPGERDFRGFKSVEYSGPVGPSGEQAFAKTWYHQGDDVAVGANNLLDSGGVPLPTVGYMRGRPYQARVSDTLGEIRSWTTTSYVADGTAPYFNPPAQVLTATALCGGSPCGKQTQTDYISYDAYGNLTEERQAGDISTTADDRTVTRSFYPNTTPWIMGSPATETVYKGLGTGGTKMAESRFYYDSATSVTTAPVKGNLTKLERWVDPGPANTYLGTTMVYDSYGNMVSTTDAKGYITSLCYDAGSTFSQRVTNPLSQQTKSEYYGVTWNTTCGTAPAAFTGSGLYGQVKSVTDPNSAQTTTEYDALGRLVKVTPADGEWTTTAYVSFGGGVGTQHVRTDTAAGLSSWTYFDGLGRTIKVRTTGPDSKTMVAETQYDSRGAVKQTSLPYFEGIDSVTGRWTTMSYDALGRPRWATNPDTTVTFTCTNDWTSIAIDANGHKRRETRDAAGRLVQVDVYTGTFAKPAVGNWTCADTGTPYATTTFQYDVVGNLVKVTDAKNNVTTMRYDTLGHKIGMADPDMGTCGDLTTLAPATSYPWYATPCWTDEYDANGNLTRQRDAKSQTIWFRYDELNRVRQKDYNTQKTLGSGDVVYTYDTVPTGFTSPPTYAQVGRLAQVVDSSGTARFGYDVMGRTLRSDKVVDGTTYQVKTAYDLAGRVASVTYPDVPASTVYYEYNGPLLKRVYEGPTNYIQYTTPNVLGQPASATYGNNVVTNYTYANTGNSTVGCTTNTFRLCTLQTAFTPSGGTLQTYQSLTYGYDAVGHVTNLTDTASSSPIGTQSFAYDELNRLGTATGPFGASGVQITWPYVYDTVGNIICNKQVSTQSTCSEPSPDYVYGSSHPHAVTGAGGNSYGYDANGNMESGAGRAMVYDYENRPVTMTVGNLETTMVYDGDGGRVKKSVRNLTTQAVTTTLYIGQLYECATACNKYIFAGSRRIAMKPVGAGTTLNYYHTDHLGSSSVVTSETGSVVERLGYYPYGQTRVNTGPVDPPYKYTGQMLDDSTGLYFYNARYYDPSLGRFLRPDPMTYDHYMYVGNNPINRIDPSGYEFCWSVGGEMICDGKSVDTTPTSGSSSSGGQSSSSGGGIPGMADPSIVNPPSWAYAFPQGVDPGPMGPTNMPGLSITQNQVVIVGQNLPGGPGGVVGSSSTTGRVSGYAAFQGYYDADTYAMLIGTDPGGFWDIPVTTNTTFVLNPGKPILYPPDPWAAESAHRSAVEYERKLDERIARFIPPPGYGGARLLRPSPSNIGNQPPKARPYAPEIGRNQPPSGSELARPNVPWWMRALRRIFDHDGYGGDDVLGSGTTVSPQEMLCGAQCADDRMF
jgi:RHS repeat-associated protein